MTDEDLLLTNYDQRWWFFATRTRFKTMIGMMNESNEDDDIVKGMMKKTMKMMISW